MSNFFEILTFFGGILRLIGLLIFGIAVGWFTWTTFNQPERKWQLQIAVYLGFLFFTALTLNFVSPGGSGAFVLGAGITLLYLGNKKGEKATETAPEED